MAAADGLPWRDRLAAAVELAHADGFGTGDWRHRFQWLAAVTGHDVVLGKFFESHFDALSILQELGSAVPVPARSLWAVWAADGPPGARLEFAADGAGAWRINGRKSWCSGARLASHALVTGRDAEGRPAMAAVRMDAPGIAITGEGWTAVGMAATDSVDVVFDQVEGSAVGAPGDYTARPGFWHGAAGIAACWHGAAAAVAQPLRAKLANAGAQADPLAAAHLGAIDAQLAGATALLRAAAAAIEAHRHGGAPFGRREALQVRAVVEAAATEVLARVGRALGAAPLCRHAQHARRVADLTVFMRQSHAEWDLAELGKLAAAAAVEQKDGDSWMLG